MNVKAKAAYSRKSSDCSDDEATNLIKDGLTDAFKREKARKAELNLVPLEKRQEDITENFPNVEGEKLITKMSESDLMALRLESYYSEKKRMKVMFKKVQEQISEYHELLEYSNKMESRLEKLRGRARFLEQECKAKSLKVSELEREVVDLKLNLATERSSSEKISNELAKVRSENQILVKTISMQSLSYASTSSARRVTSRGHRINSVNMLDNSEQFRLVRPHPKQSGRMSPLSFNDDFSEHAIDDNCKSGPVNDLVNLTVSWMNNRKWGSKASFASEQNLPRAKRSDFASNCCIEKSDATATTAEVSNISMISTLDNSNPKGFKNADWNVIRPMNASTNPLLKQLNEGST